MPPLQVQEIRAQRESYKPEPECPAVQMSGLQKDILWTGRIQGRDRAPNVITRALREVAHGLSPKGVQSVMAGDGIRVHQSTIHRWSKDYADMMSEYSKSIRPWTGYRWHCDEIYLKIRGQGAMALCSDGQF